MAAILATRDLKSAKKAGLLPRHFGEPRPMMAYTFLLKYAEENNGDIPTPDIFIRRTGFDLPIIEGNVQVGSLAKEIVKLSRSRALERALPDLEEIRRDPDGVALRLFAKSREILAEGDTADTASIQSSLTDFRSDLASQSDVWGWLYPWNALNETSLGMQRGEWIVIYGRPGCLKTWVLLSMAISVAEQYPRSIGLFYNCELPNKIIKRRSMSLLLQQPYNIIRRKQLTAEAEASLSLLESAITDGTGEMGELVIVKPKTTSFAEFVQTVDKVRPDIVFIDSVYKMVLDDTMADSREQRALAGLSSAICALLRERNIPGVGTVQANRTKADGKSIGPEGGSDVGYSDALAQDADTLLRLYPFVDTDDTKKLLVEVAKGREFDIGGLVVSPPPTGACKQQQVLTNSAAVEAEKQKIGNKGKQSRKVRADSTGFEEPAVEVRRGTDEAGAVQVAPGGQDPELP